MNGKLFASIGLMAALAASAGCAGGKSGSATATPNAEIQRERAALPLGQAAAVPRDLHCAGAPVWVNEHTRVYHAEGDPYYGRTRNGKYMCTRDAEDAGFRPAGSHRNGWNGSTSGPSEYSHPSRRRHHRSSTY